MKWKISSCFLICALIGIMATGAADGISSDPVKYQSVTREALQELHKIVDSHFSLPQYSIELDQESSLDSRPIIPSNAGAFVEIPRDVICHILRLIHDFPRSQKALALTCRCLYQRSLPVISQLRLTHHSLQEGIPHSMPVEVLLRKVRHTTNGMLRLASLYSVYPPDLRTWFSPAELQGAVPSCLPIPESVESLTEDDFVDLIPRLKVLIAALPIDGISPTISTLNEFFNSQRQMIPPFSDSWCLLSILHTYICSEDWDSIFFNFGCIIHTKRTTPEQIIAADLIACTSLKKPRQFFTVMTGGYFNFRKEKRSLQLNCIEWFWKNRTVQELDQFFYGGPTQELYQCAQAALRIHRSFHGVGGPVITEILRTEILRDTSSFLQCQIKANCIEACEAAPELDDASKHLSEFIREHWQENHWVVDPNMHCSLESFHKKTFIRQLLRTGVRDCIPLMYEDLATNPQLMDSDDELIEDLVAYDFLVQANDCVNRSLTVESPYFLVRIYNVVRFTHHLVQLDAHRFFPLMRDKFEQESIQWTLAEKLNNYTLFLIGLATCETSKGYREYISEKSQMICEKVATLDFEARTLNHLSVLFFHIGEEDLCKKYYQQWVGAMLQDDPGKQTVHLQDLNDMGISVSSLEALNAEDPDKVISKLSYNPKSFWFMYPCF